MKRFILAVLVLSISVFAVPASALVTSDEALSAVLDFLGSTAEATDQRVEESSEDGVAVYELSFSLDARRYEAEVSREDGTLLSLDVKKTALPEQGTARMTESEIRARALEILGLPETADTGLRSKKERDDGRDLYELYVTSNEVSFELTLDAETGEMLEYERKSADAVSSASKNQIERNRVQCEDCSGKNACGL